MTHPRYQGPCGWQALLTPRCPSPALDGALECDLAVVGAGHTGLAAARTWAAARPQDRLAVLEAGVVGDHGGGRRSGLMPGVALLKDSERIARVSALLRDVIVALRGQLRDAGNPCLLIPADLYRAAVTTRGARTLEAARGALVAARLPHEWLDGAAVDARLGIRGSRCGLYLPECSAVQPAALVRRLADVLPENVTLFEETPALGVRAAGGRWEIDCPAGVVRARRVVLANNGFAAALIRSLRARLMVVYGYLGLTGRLPPDAQTASGESCCWAWQPIEPAAAALSRTADGRVLVVADCRSVGGEKDLAAAAGRLENHARQRLPGLAAAASGPLLEQVWSRAAGVTANGSPVWGELAPGLLVSAGCNGGSPLTSALLGSLLAMKALGERVPDVPALLGAPSRLPPAPLRRFGFLAHRAGSLHI